MFQITKDTSGHTNLYLTRGDTAHIKITVDGYTFTSEDTVILTVKSKTSDVEYLFQEVMVGDEITIKPSDTRTLSFGSYIYDIQAVFANGDVVTFFEPSTITIGEEVTTV